jgi:hypothetical protein
VRQHGALKNWIDDGSLPAVRIGRRVRVRRVDLERILAQGTSGADEPEPSPVASDTLVEAREQLAQALEPARADCSADAAPSAAPS